MTLGRPRAVFWQASRRSWSAIDDVDDDLVDVPTDREADGVAVTVMVVPVQLEGVDAPLVELVTEEDLGLLGGG